ncbi:uracil-DNA glycosylase family protein [Neisseria perflava]|uniref:uracil-DNA glycosylase family protein n=1 Tax=Neisseria perflava TaxID=33053 RepID=UPI0020A1F1A6|nr:uracil-DNA glycosylase family protein [Neisseria perflava]MCP1660781.1 DNA polymerase [Neisseria perflava]MCP1771464.1 DNA polymerase [Neisseria perflava]
MLSSRYLHLHEALGLGPMWLNREAVFRPSEKSAVAPQVSATPAAPTAAVKPVAQAVQAAAQPSAARLAAINALKTPKAAAARTVPDNRAPDTAPQARTAAEPHAAAVPADFSDGLAAPLHSVVMPSEIMVISICPATEDSLNGQLFCGSVGVLLDNILASVGLTPQQAHKTCWVKTPPVFKNTPDAAQMQAALPQLLAEREQSAAKAVLFLGQIFEQEAQADLMAQLCGGLPYFVIPHPARLLRQPQLKAQAWAELKKLKRLLASQAV